MKNCSYTNWTTAYDDIEVSETRVKAFSVKGTNASKINDLKNQDSIQFARFCSSGIRRNPELIERMVYSDE